MITAHSDVVGSLLRPAELLKDREDVVAGRISQVEFKAIEDRAVDQAIALQEEAGLEVSPQCGFSKSVVGNAITIEDERYKLETIVKTARQVWG